MSGRYQTRSASKSPLRNRGADTVSAGLPVCLVVGGGGFVGQHVVRQLLDEGRYAVRVFDVREVAQPGVEAVVGDIRNLAQVEAATAGVTLVIHVATAAPTGENSLNRELMDGVNVKGTANVLEACVRCGVPRLVYTSSASVVFEGKPLVNVDESQPYCTEPFDYYTKTKVEGEKMVLAANSLGGLSTVALRPSGIFGPGDAVFVPTLVRQAKKGKMKFIIGDGKNLMDWTYVGNVAQAHLQAAEALAAPGGAAKLGGRTYFITNQDPRPFWEFIGDVLQGLGYARPAKHLPMFLILFLAMVFEYVLRPLLRPLVSINSDFTVNRIKIVTRHRYFKATAATRDFGYKPRVAIEEAVRLTTAAFPQLRADAEGAAADAPRVGKAA